jgi:hypothetical protein
MASGVEAKVQSPQSKTVGFVEDRCTFFDTGIRMLESCPKPFDL